MQQTIGITLYADCASWVEKCTYHNKEIGEFLHKRPVWNCVIFILGYALEIVPVPPVVNVNFVRARAIESSNCLQLKNLSPEYVFTDNLSADSDFRGGHN